MIYVWVYFDGVVFDFCKSFYIQNGCFILFVFDGYWFVCGVFEIIVSYIIQYSLSVFYEEQVCKLQ